MAPLPEAMGPGARRRRGAPAEPSESTDLRAIAADVRRVPPLRPGEQERLLQSISSTREPNPARERLLETHLAMVLAVATQKQGRGLGIGDLFQEGSVGLLRAIASYPASGRSDFDAYVRDQVALAIEDALAGEAEAVRQEGLLVEAANDYERVELLLGRELRRAPTAAEIGARLEWTPQRTEQIREIVAEARRRHDEELLLYIDPERIDVDPGDLLPGEDGDDGRD